MYIVKKLRSIFLAVTLLIFVVIELPIIAIGNTTVPQPGDVIIVLGAKAIGRVPSTMLQLRLDEALKLYSSGYAKTIIVSGGKGADEVLSEAQVMFDYLIIHGIPAQNILIEDNSFSTYQNLVNSHRIMKQNGLKKAIIVSNTSHIRRSLVLAHNLGMEASGAPAPMANNYYLTAKQYVREGAAMISLLVFNK
ncbi:YdcF family protein [Dendrosporobacter sp. 1207_IL3150]|uniref:YdcF family protein n=1 Tax=Dendrosporobacter sp. 1207_IL3150 TaxID=3084054 RepID=UPI002FD901F7